MFTNMGINLEGKERISKFASPDQTQSKSFEGAGSEEGISREGEPAVAPAKRRTAAQRYESSSPPIGRAPSAGGEALPSGAPGGKRPPTEPAMPLGGEPPTSRRSPPAAEKTSPRSQNPPCMWCNLRGGRGGDDPFWGEEKEAGAGQKRGKKPLGAESG